MKLTTEQKLQTTIDFIKKIEGYSNSYDENYASTALQNLKEEAWHILANIAD